MCIYKLQSLSAAIQIADGCMYMVQRLRIWVRKRDLVMPN